MGLAKEEHGEEGDEEDGKEDAAEEDGPGGVAGRVGGAGVIIVGGGERHGRRWRGEA